jgi:hypothetical protein
MDEFYSPNQTDGTSGPRETRHPTPRHELFFYAQLLNTYRGALTYQRQLAATLNKS